MLKAMVMAYLCVGMIAHAAGANNFTKGREIEPLPTELKPGDYVWVPEVSPSGPVGVIVSIPEQALFVYRNGVRIGRATVCTGAKGQPFGSTRQGAAGGRVCRRALPRLLVLG